MADRPRRSSLGLVAGILATGVAVTLLLVWWARRERAERLEQWRARLSATVEDRRAGVDAWIEERIGDALVVAQYPSTLSLLDRRARASRPLSDQSSGADHLRDVLGRLRGIYRYRAVWIVDASGGVAVSSGSVPPDPRCLEIAREVQAHREPLVVFHERSDGGVVVGAAAPVLAAEGRPLGAVLIEIDPTRNVYLMLTTEPAPTRSGETLLVKEEGADVVFLSPLRHGPEGSLRARRPFAPPGLAASAALSGVEAFGEFVDYRGVRVLAATRRLRNAPWGIVTKIDADEAFKGYREELAQAAAAGAGLLLAAGGVGFGLWRQRTVSARLALARSEARFGLLLEHAPDVVLFARSDGRIVNVNRRAEELYGYGRAELLAMRIHALYPPRVGADTDARMDGVRHGSGLAFEADHLTRDGRLVPVEVSSRFVEVDGEGLFLSIVRDVSERKAAEKRIALLNRLLRTLSEVNRAMARESDPERLVSEACRILVAHGGFRMAWIGLGDPGTGQVVPAAWSGHDDGYLSEVIVGKDDTPLEHGPAWTSLHEGRTVVVADVETDERFAPWREAARRRGYRSLAAAPVPTSGGTPTVLALYAAEPGVFEAEVVEVLEELAGDVGFALRSIEADRERTQALEDLRASEASPGGAHYRLPSRSSPWGSTGGWARSGTPRPRRCSAGALRGRSAPRPASCRPSTRKSPAGPAPAPPRRAVVLQRRARRAGAVTARRSTSRRRRSRPRRRGERRASPRHGRRHERARSGMEAALRETREQLLQSQKLEAVGRLAGGVAHDFNNILGVVLGHAELLLRKLPPGDENRPRLEQIMTAARRAAVMTRQLLAFSRRQVLRPQVVDLNAVVMDTREILERLIGEDIELRTRLEPDLGRVEVDPGQIGQVLMNLALNARDAMPEGGTLAIETANATLDQAIPGEPDTLLPGSYVRLRVCDTGTGIEEPVRPHIFEPFFTTKAQGLGSGLGLSTVYGIVTQSGGTIQVDSSPGPGTAFTIHLPRLEDAAAVVSAPPVEEAPRGGPETILVVEDQDELRSLMCEVLGDAGHTVLAAANGLEALARAESHAGPVHLLLTDVVMPGMSGRELAERLTALRPGLRVLFVSGYASDVVAKRGVLEERVNLLEKPFSRVSLLRWVRRALDGEPFNPGAPPGSWRPAPRA